MKERKYRRALITAHTSHNGWAIPKTVIQLNGCGVPVDPSNTSLPYLVTHSCQISASMTEISECHTILNVKIWCRSVYNFLS